MTVQISPYSGTAGCITIDERNVNTVRLGKTFASMQVHHHVEGDLCLAMCPGVRMVKGFSKMRGLIASSQRENVINFHGWAVVDPDATGQEALTGFELAIDFEIQLSRSGPHLKLWSASRYNWSTSQFQVYKPSFTNLPQWLSPEQANSISEFCQALGSCVRPILAKYATEVHSAVYAWHKTYRCDPATGRPEKFKNPNRGLVYEPFQTH